MSPTLRKNVSNSTAVKVAAFGQLALLDPKAGRELHEASTKVNLSKADNKWEQGLKNGEAFVAVHNKFSDHFNQRINEVNNKYPADRDWSKEDYSNPKDPTFKKYVNDIHKLTRESIEKAANDLNLENPSGTKEVKVEQDPQEPLTFKMTVHDKTAKHAVEDDPGEITFKVTYVVGAKGRITGFDIDNPAAALAQSVNLGAEFILEHYGVKGMRWGFRRETPTAVAPTAVSKIPHGTKRKTKIKTEGGENQPAHEDAIKVAEARAKLKKSGTAALSNQELREVANRLQLEAQVATLSTSRGQKFVMRELETGSKQVVKRGAKQGAKRYGPKVVKRAGRTAATVATTAALL
jgi:hypothetical protein